MGEAREREAVRRAVRSLLAEDRARGALRSAEQYKRLFAGFWDVVAEEFDAVSRVPDTPLHGTPERSPPTPDTPRIPSTEIQQVGPYRVLKEIGRGGMGVVYLAEDTRVGRKVALKVLTESFASSPHIRTRFRREASITSRLDHPGICTVYEAGEEDGVAFMAMRYLEGASLATWVADSIRTMQGTGRTTGCVTGLPDPGPASGTRAAPDARHPEIGRILVLFEDLARALHVAHEAGLVHRDVKPANVMVTTTGSPVLLDFGLARSEDDEPGGLTRTGALMGTPAYLSPEQLVAQRIKLDRRTDVYSLGVALYECLTLRLPFEAPTLDALYQKILATDPESPRSVNPAVPTDLKVVVETAIDKDRNRRYQTALDMAEDLRRVRQHEPIRARAVGPAGRLLRWFRRNPALAAATGGIFVALSAGLGASLHLLDVARAETRAREGERDAKEAALRASEQDRKTKDEALAETERALKRAEAEKAEADRGFEIARANRDLFRAALRARTVTGPAEVELADGGRIALRAGAVLKDLRPERAGGADLVLVSGGIDAHLRGGEVIASPVALVQQNSPSDPAEMYLECGPDTLYIKVRKDSGPVSFRETTAGATAVLEQVHGFWLRAPRSEVPEIELITDAFPAPSGSPEFRFSTPREREMTLRVPPASTCLVRFQPSHTTVFQYASSWRAGKSRILTRVAGAITGQAEIGPSVEVNIDGEFGTLTERRMEGGEDTARIAVGPRGSRPGTLPKGEKGKSGAPPVPVDWAKWNTKPGTDLDEGAGDPVVVTRFETALEGAAPGVSMTLRNDGPPRELLTVEATFGYPPPEGSYARYIPECIDVHFADFGAGEERSVTVSAPGAPQERPLFARIAVHGPMSIGATAARESTGGQLRKGTPLLGGRVEVVDIQGDLASTTPTLSFTLEHVDRLNPESAIEGMRWTTQFYGSDGALIELGRRFYALKPVDGRLGKLGDRISIRVSGLAPVPGLPGARAVLRLVQ